MDHKDLSLFPFLIIVARYIYNKVNVVLMDFSFLSVCFSIPSAALRSIGVRY